MWRVDYFSKINKRDSTFIREISTVLLYTVDELIAMNWTHPEATKKLAKVNYIYIKHISTLALFSKIIFIPLKIFTPKLRHQGAICWLVLAIWLSSHFFRNKTFFMIDSRNFQHLFDFGFCETSQNFSSFSLETTFNSTFFYGLS